nr:hypothetical protein [uncultured Lichenicoccus sp.]
MGLRPQADHPDAGLLQLLEQERRLAAAWIGEDWIDTTACTRLLEEIARTPAHTLVGLLEKADRALEPARARRHEVVEPIASALDEACTMLRRQADEIAALRGQR